MNIYFYEDGSWATCEQNNNLKYWEINEDSELFNKIYNADESLLPVIENDKLIDVIVNSEEIKRNNILNEIASLKQELTNGDYKVIKCYEATMLQLEPPYDLNLLVQERQALRDRINELEKEL